MSKLLKNVIKCQWSVHKVYIDFCKRYVLAKDHFFLVIYFVSWMTLQSYFSFFYQDKEFVNMSKVQCISRVVVLNSIFKRLAIFIWKVLHFSWKFSQLNIKNDVNLETYKGKFKLYYKVWKAIEANGNKNDHIIELLLKESYWIEYIIKSRIY